LTSSLRILKSACARLAAMLLLGVAPLLAHGVVRAAPATLPSTGLPAMPGMPSTAADPNPPIAGRVDPATYRVGPGDEFALLYSDLAEPRIVRVGPTGTLLLPDVGALAAAGLTLEELESRVRERMRPYVRGRGFGFSLYRPRRFRMYVTGEVGQPGSVTLQAPARASEAVLAAGGVAYGGALRGIEVRRGSETLRADLVLSSRGGRLDADPLVFESDVIYVPPSRVRIEIGGAVAHAGRYDYVPGDRTSDLVALAGGLLAGAAPADATIERFDPEGGAERSPLRLDEAIAAPGSPADEALREGDRLFVPGRPRWQEGDQVTLVGEVARPGPYPIRSGVDRLSTVLAAAGGFTASADSAGLRIERTAAGPPSDSLFLRLTARNPDLLTPAERDYVAVTARERQALSAGAARTLGDPVLHDGERIVVPRRIGLIGVQGEVRAPGFVPYAPGRRVGDYVEDAGGYTSRAYKSRIRVTRAATGARMDAGEAGILREGDVVWVPTRPDHSTWASVRDVLTTAAQVATIYLVVREATK
jgi:protein involved in polysaccharide export with SLBB domain